eukprot:734651-Amphidinium_carterae.2
MRWWTAVDVEVEEQAVEVAMQLARRQPHEPTAEDILQQEACHKPFRSWCRVCPAGQALQDKHKQQDRDDGLVDAAEAVGSTNMVRKGLEPLISRHR